MTIKLPDYNDSRLLVKVSLKFSCFKKISCYTKQTRTIKDKYRDTNKKHWWLTGGETWRAGCPETTHLWYWLWQILNTVCSELSRKKFFSKIQRKFFIFNLLLFTRGKEERKDDGIPTGHLPLNYHDLGHAFQKN